MSDRRDGIALHARHQMRVRVVGQARGSVTEPFRDDLARDARLPQQRRVCMTKIVQPKLRQAVLRAYRRPRTTHVARA